MTGSTRVTITLWADMLCIGCATRENRSRFILEAAHREIVRRRKEALATSLDHPHPESSSLEASGLAEWFEAGEGDASRLLDSEAGMDIQWIPDKGWVTVEK